MPFQSERWSLVEYLSWVRYRDADRLDQEPSIGSVEPRDKKHPPASPSARGTKEPGRSSIDSHDVDAKLRARLSDGTLRAQGWRGDRQGPVLVPQCYWESFDFEHLAPAASGDTEFLQDITFSRRGVLHFFPDHYRQFMAMDLNEVAGLTRETPVSFVEIDSAWQNSLAISDGSDADEIKDDIWQQLYKRAFGPSVVQFQSGYTPGGPLWSVKTTAFETDQLAAYLLAEVQKGIDGYEAAWGPQPNVTPEELGGISARWFWSGQGKEDYDKRLGIMLDDFVLWWSLTGLPMPPFLDCLFEYEDAPDYSAPDPIQARERRVRQPIKTLVIREAVRELYPTGIPLGIPWKTVIAEIQQESGTEFDRTTVARACVLEFGKPKRPAR